MRKNIGSVLAVMTNKRFMSTTSTHNSSADFFRNPKLFSSKDAKFLILKESNVENCFEIFNEMKKRSTKFDPLLALSLIVTCMRNKQHDRIEDLWDSLVASFLKMNSSSLATIKHWDYVISGLCQSGRVLQAHELIIRNKMHLSAKTLNILLNALVIEEMTSDALYVLRNMKSNFDTESDAWHYSTVIKGLCNNDNMRRSNTDNMRQVLDLVKEMEQKGLKIDSILLTILCQACSKFKNVDLCEYLNTKFKEFSKSDVLLINSLIGMNLNCGSAELAEKYIRKLLDEKRANATTFEIIIAGYGSLGNEEKTLHYFKEMNQYGLEYTETVLSHMMNANTKNYSFVLSLFKDLTQKYKIEPNTFHYNALIKSCVESNNIIEALEILKRMTVPPDDVSLTLIAKGCAKAAAKGFSQELHDIVMSRPNTRGIQLINTLLFMNFRTARVEQAEELFQSIRPENRNVITFNTMINGYGLNGRGKKAIQYFNTLSESPGLKPNQLTYVGVLNACSHCNMQQDAELIFSNIVEKSSPIVNCMIDLYSRSGNFKKVIEFLTEYRQYVNYTSYMAILGGCRKSLNIELAELIFPQLLALRDDDASAYVLMANIYAGVGNFQQSDLLREEMTAKGLKKIPGMSQVEINNTIHTFFVQNNKHPEIDDTLKYLKQLNDEIVQAGYQPDLKWVVRDLEDDEKRDALCKHSEKIALAYALMKTPPSDEIMITKNLRMCGDCHEATKVISKVKNRVIHVRDASRFHRFENGKCSCGDGW